jgi:hypothetical protein
MNRARGNPDRDFSADHLDEQEAQQLRDLLKSSDIASILTASSASELAW